MTFETWDNLINHVITLSAVRKFEQQSHILYVSDMYAELQKFSDEDISIAARSIVEKENLFGNYPPLAVWLKYIPQKRAEENEAQSKLQEFLNWCNFGMTCDRLYFDANKWADEFYEKFGEFMRPMLKMFGGCERIIDAYKTSEYNQREILADARKAFIRFAEDQKLNVPAIASQPDLKRIK